MKRFVFVMLFFCTLFFVNESEASARDAFVTVVNPVRISSYTTNIAESLAAQSKIVQSFNLPATWLVTYDVLQVPQAVETLKQLPQTNEIGLFLEITPELAKKANVSYKAPEQWYHPNALFLSGYTQVDRRKLIDTLFVTFKDTFGRYPTSVGSWYTDEYSLVYVYEKYGVTAALMCSDQYATDNYQLWGQYWGAPYYPSRINAAQPGVSSNQLKLLLMPWALRDPLHGYFSSLYSTQDYFTTKENLTSSYFEKLLSTYLFDEHNKFGHAVVGLEGDFNPEMYQTQFKEQLSVVARMRDQKKITTTTMKVFAQWYQSSFKETAPMHFVTKDLLGGEEVIEWYESPLYRVGIRYTQNSSQVTFFDLREYNPLLRGPFYVSPNRSKFLSVVVPFTIDAVSNPDQIWIVPVGRDKITFEPDAIYIQSTASSPSFVRNSTFFALSNNENNTIIRPAPWMYPIDGKEIKSLTPESDATFRSLKFKIFIGVFVIILVGLYFKKKRRVALVLFLLFFGKLYFQASSTYLVTSGELEALSFLASQEKGAILVPDQYCLQCEYHTKLKPLVFLNNRQYVSELTGNKLVQKNLYAVKREDAKTFLAENSINYIYLTSIEAYQEGLPFSPGNWGVKKVFQNANATIWERENNY